MRRRLPASTPRPTSRLRSRRSSRSSIARRWRFAMAFASCRRWPRARRSSEHLAGELIECEVEVKTGRCERFAEAARLVVERRRQLYGLVDRLGAELCACGTHPWSPWTEQRIIDTPALPPGGAVAPLRRLAQQHVRHPRARRRPGPRACDRADEPPAVDPPRPARAERQLAVDRREAHAPPLDPVAALHPHVSRAAAFPSRSRAGATTTRSAVSCSTRARSASTRRSGGASAPTRRSARSSCGTRTARPTYARRSRSRPSAT